MKNYFTGHVDYMKVNRPFQEVYFLKDVNQDWIETRRALTRGQCHRVKVDINLGFEYKLNGPFSISITRLLCGVYIYYTSSASLKRIQFSFLRQLKRKR